MLGQWALLTLILWWARARPAFDAVIGAALCVSLLVSPGPGPSQLLTLLVTVTVIIEQRAHVLSGMRSGRPTLLGLVLAIAILPWVLVALGVLRGGPAWTVLVPIALLALVILSDLRARVGVRGWTAENEGRQIIGELPSNGLVSQIPHP